MWLGMKDAFEELGSDACEEMCEASRWHVSLGGDLEPNPSEQSVTDEMCENIGLLDSGGIYVAQSENGIH